MKWDGQMKTKDFINKIRELGYSPQLEIKTQFKWLDITIDDDELMERDKQVARIATAWEAWGTLNSMEFSGSNEIELLNVITEYLVTPLTEREEEKKYRYELPVLNTNDRFLHLHKYSRNELRIDDSRRDFALTDGTFHFTDKEVEQFTGKDRALFDACEKIEVAE